MRFPPSVVELAHDWAPERTSAGPERRGGLGGFAESCAGGLSCDNGTEEGGKQKKSCSSRLEWKNGMEAAALLN
jgi:hypothetical protein